MKQERQASGQDGGSASGAVLPMSVPAPILRASGAGRGLRQGPGRGIHMTDLARYAQVRRLLERVEEMEG